MGFLGVFSICVLSVCLLAVLIICLKSGRFIKSLFLNAIIGILVLVAINLLSRYTGIKIPVNEYTVPFCALCGIPGIILFIMLPIIFF